MNVALIITAAGSSTRFGEDKLFLNINGIPLIQKTILAFSSAPISTAVITHHPSQKSNMEAVLKQVHLPFPVRLVEGGNTRKDSVENAVNTLTNVQAVLIHDGARPNVSLDLIIRLINAGQTKKAVIPALKVTDSMKWVENGIVVRTIDRRFLVRVQTPQCFDIQVLKEAYKHHTQDATDEAMLLETLGVEILVVDGDEANIKVTYPEDVKFLT